MTLYIYTHIHFIIYFNSIKKLLRLQWVPHARLQGILVYNYLLLSSCIAFDKTRQYFILATQCFWFKLCKIVRTHQTI